jgi:hypothetical protein
MVGLDDLSDDRQAQACAADGSIARRIQSDEASEHRVGDRPLVLRPVVRDDHPGMATDGRAFESNAIVCVPDGIVDQISDETR